MLDQELLSLKEYFFYLIRHFFSPNFENLPNIASFADLSYLTMGYSGKKQTAGLRGGGG